MEEREEAITLYVARAAGKLRFQSSVTGDMPVTIRTNPFKPIEPQYSHGLIIPLSEATDDTLKLTQTLIFDLKPIYRPGYAYIKVGIMLVEIVQNNQTQVDLFPGCQRSNKVR